MSLANRRCTHDVAKRVKARDLISMNRFRPVGIPSSGDSVQWGFRPVGILSSGDSGW